MQTLFSHIRFYIVLILVVALAGTNLLYAAAPAHAAVSSWLRGANVVPLNSTDFGSASFQQSMRNLRATGATSVALVIPYYQSNIYSTDIGPGSNTPSDASLASGIDYLHSIGFSVMLKPHIDPYDGNWRAFINPADRATWFTNYGNVLVHLGQVGAQHHVELISLGTELVSMSVDQINSTNTQNWLSMIQRMRAVYSGSLIYTANSTDNNNDPFANEKKFVGFWSSLDYAGLSAYYTISTGDNSVASLESSWDYWNKNDIQAFSQSVGKAVLFSELGYRSVTGAHTAPWNWSMGGSPDMTEQSNDYHALFEYWNTYSYMQGVYLWYWSTDPNAGGTTSTDYTPQNKPAEQMMTQWFTSAPTPPAPSTAPVFSDTTTASPTNPTASTGTTITTSVHDTSSSLTGGIVDIEVYNAANQRLTQNFIPSQSFSSGSSQSYTTSWTPSSAGTYRVTVGVFSGDWSTNYYWNNDALDITVGVGGTTNPPATGGSGSQITDVWWPLDGSTVSGVQPLKAMVENSDVSQYSMTWSVDGGSPVPMYSNATDYPHKEVLIDFSNWHWNGAGPYTITLTSNDLQGNLISSKSIRVFVQ